MNISENARRVLEKRYLARDETGALTESVEGLFARVARAIAEVDAYYDPNADIAPVERTFYERMTKLEFMPNSPTLMNAGRHLGQLSACFVLPVPDSMEGIFDAVKQAALIHKSGGGTGFSFSRLRQAGAAVRSTGGVASGPVSFMRVFNSATEAVKQGGTRRGANMGVLSVAHPDILEFMDCKRGEGLSNFNISVGLTEDFMEAVETGKAYALRDPRDGSVAGSLDARDVFARLVENAWGSGEPGILFLDRLNRDNPTPELGEFESTNPCGEQPLLPYESCNLGSINLQRFVRRDAQCAWEIDYGRLGECVWDAVHFLDNVIDANRYPMDEIEQTTKRLRKIGLGVMGFADVLYRLGIPYDSEAAVALAEAVMGFIQAESKRASAKLAEARGAFGEFARSRWSQGEPLRNATTTTIAPTGTISILCGASSGVEPLFALSFVRTVMDGEALPEVHPLFEEVARERGFYSEALMRDVAKAGSVRGMEAVPEDVRAVFCTAHDISPEAHIRMQAAFQRHTDNAVSKTVNFPHDATRESVRAVFLLAWKLGCKGVTIYRDGSRDAQVLVRGEQTEQTEKARETKLVVNEQGRVMPRPRPAITQGITEKVRIGCGNLYITVNFDEEGICEVFTNLGRAGGCPSQSEATSRLVSMALRSGMDVDTIIEQLRGIRCHSTIRSRDPEVRVLSCPDAIGMVLEKVQRIRNGQGDLLSAARALSAPKRTQTRESACAGNCSLCAQKEACPTKRSACPECGEILEHSSGCVVCRECGYSRCN